MRLRAGEVRIKDEACRRSNKTKRAVGFKLRAIVGSSSVLPHDGPMSGLTGGSIPRDDRFALVGDSNCGDGFARCIERCLELGEDELDRRPNLVGIVFDPSGLGEELSEFPVRR
jgi:hypothetical protein